MFAALSSRKKGFANSLVLSIGLLILLALAAFNTAQYFLVGQPTVARLADSQMRLAAERLETRLIRLQEGVESTLRASQSWGINGGFDQMQLQRFNEFFFPILGEHNKLLTIILAHESGREISLHLNQDGNWENRISNPAEWGEQTYWITWNARHEITKVEIRPQGYDARQRPWFTGALQLQSSRAIHWTAPYVFFTAQAPGITASMRWQAADGSSYVIAHDLLLSELTEYTALTDFSPNGKAALLLADGRLIAPPLNDAARNGRAIADTLLKTAAELDIPELAAGFRYWQANQPMSPDTLHRFTHPGGDWLALFRPVHGPSPEILLGIVAPQSDFVPVTRQDFLLLGLITLSALALGMVVAIRIARHFGAPLLELTREAERIGRLQLHQSVDTAAPWQEVRQLAGALDAMRCQLLDSQNMLQNVNTDLEQSVARRTLALQQSEAKLKRREAFFRAVFDNAAVAIVSLDAEHKPLLVNRAFAAFVDYPMETLLANPDTRCLPEAEHLRLLAACSEIVAGRRKNLRDEFSFFTRHGETRWGDVQITAVRNDDGGVDSVLITILDITERRNIESELIRQFSLMRALLDTLPNPIFYKGAHTRFLGCNRAYEAFFGVDRGDIVGKRVLDLDYLPSAARQNYQAEDEAIIAECGRLTREIQMTAADGSLRDTLYSISGFRDTDGKPGGLIGVIVDITPLKEAKREAEQAQAEAESAAAAKASFLANMSHEIRTPMNAIIGMTHLTLQTALTNRQKNYLTKVDNAAKGLLGIINDILDLSKIEAGMMHFEQAPFSLDDCLRQLGDLCSLNAHQRGLELIYDIAPQTPDRLVGDSLRLGQVLLNLVGNAIKFTEHGTVTLTVRPLARHDGRVELAFEVRDTGIGISGEHLAQLFTAFTQADTSTTRKYGGSGLGLSICKRIVELQGGSITASSQPGAGSCFSVRLPFGVAGESTSPPPRISLPPGRPALVVADSTPAREVLARLLGELAIDHQAVADPAEALSKLGAGHPPYALLLVDWAMPDFDRLARLDQLCQRAGEQDTAIIMMADAHDHEAVLAALGQHAVKAMLGKPVTRAALAESLIEALGTKPIPQPGQSALVAGPRPGLSRPRVLLVEDNEVNRELAEELLRNMGLLVDLAKNGQEAIERVRDTPYDLVLMDCQMPVMDGYAATRAIRNELHLDRLPIVAMTADALLKDRERCRECGMNDHIAKPIDVAVLHATLGRWLNQASDPQADRGAAISNSEGDIDTTTALARLGGNRTMYQRLIRRFRENHSDVIDRLQADRAHGDASALLLRLHTLRGLAETIGAATLARLAGELEEYLKRGSPLDDGQIDKLLASLESALPGVLALADGIGEPPAGATLAPAAIDEALSNLQRLLDNDDAQAVRLFDDIALWLSQESDAMLVDQLRQQIGRYDFELAAATLQQITTKLRHA